MSATSTIPPVTHGSPELARLLADLAAGASERDRTRTAPHAQIEQLRAAGLGRLRIPVAEGGGGATVRELFTVLIALAEADPNIAHALRVHFSFVEQQLVNPDAEGRARWLALVNDGHVFGNAMSEQGDRGVGQPLATRLRLDPGGDGFRLDGEKFYSTGNLYATWTQVLATAPDGASMAMATIPLDREGVTLADDWDGFGQRLTGTGTTRLDDVHVRLEELAELGPFDPPAAVERPPSYWGAFLQLYLQAVTAGILRSVRADAVALVRRRRRRFSAGGPVPAQDPQFLQVVGEIAADAFAAEAIVLAAADAIGAAADSVGPDGLPDRALAQQAQLSAAQAKVAIDRFSTRTASALFDAGGASATQAAHNLDRHWRNVRTISTHNPTHLKARVVGDHLVNDVPPPLNGLF
jgi:alkylation response protein AidB-like acyl-CoA dehydrogenase